MAWKAGPDSDDVIVASSGQAVLVYVKEHEVRRIQAIVSFVQTQQWGGVIFTSAKRPTGKRVVRSENTDPYGWVDGTFSLEWIHAFNAERGADILLTFPWTSEKNTFGRAGTDFTATGGATRLLKGPASGHGGLSPWNIRNTFLAWGVDFKAGITVRVPASNVDIVPTILALKGIKEREQHDGRVLSEALKGGPDYEQIRVETRVLTTVARDGHYQADLQISVVGTQRYLDLGDCGQ